MAGIIVGLEMQKNKIEETLRIGKLDKSRTNLNT